MQRIDCMGSELIIKQDLVRVSVIVSLAVKCISLDFELVDFNPVHMPFLLSTRYMKATFS